MKKLKTLLVLAVVSLVGFNAKAQNFAPIEAGCNQGRYLQNFNTTTALNTLEGWNINATYQGNNDGGSALTGVYSYGTGTNIDRAFGLLRTSGGNPMIGIQFQNLTPAPIYKITVKYKGEQWRKGNTLNDRLQFTYSIDNATPVTITGTGYRSVDQLDFVSVQNGTICSSGGTKLLGNSIFRNYTYTINLDVPVDVGGYIMLRWQDFNQMTCHGHGLAIDDLDVTFSNDLPNGPVGEIIGSNTVCNNGSYDYGVQGLPDLSDLPNLGIVANWYVDGVMQTTNANGSFTYSPTVSGVYTIQAEVLSGCFETIYRTFSVKVVDPPALPGTVSILERNCNNVTLQLTGNSDPVIRWEVVPTVGTPTTIETSATTLSYQLTSASTISAITATGASCEVSADLPLTLNSIPTLILTANTQCSGGGILATANTTGTFVITPDPNRVGSQVGMSYEFTNLPAGTYTVVFIQDPIIGNDLCSVSKSITLGSNPNTAVMMRIDPYARTRNSITPEWFAYRGASSYTLQWRLTGVNTWSTISGITATRRAVSALSCNTSYQFRVRAICSTGTASPYSAISSWSTLGCAREGISSDLTASDLSLYPNPNNGNFNLNFVAEGAGAATLFVADITGKTVTNQTITLTEGENNIPVSLDGVAPGIYLVRFTVGENTFTQKVIVE